MWISLLILFTSPVFGQIAKSALTEADYGNWGTLRLNKISKDGKWVVCNMYYESGKDTLFLVNTQSNRKIAIAGGKRPEFANGYFTCQAKDSIVLVNLNKGRLEKTLGTDYFLSKRNNLLVYLKTSKNSSLVFQTPSHKPKLELENVIYFQFSPDQSKVLYVGKKGDVSFVGIVDILSLKSKILVEEQGQFASFEWSKNGHVLTFLQSFAMNSTFDKVLHYNVQAHQLRNYGVSDSMVIVQSSFSPHALSDDGGKVFFHVRPKVLKQVDPKAVEIWKGSDKWTFNLLSKMDGGNNLPKTIVWIPSEDKFEIIASSKLPHAKILNGGRYALLSNPQSYSTDSSQFPSRDYYLLEVEKATVELLLKKQSSPPEKIYESPDGQQLVYYRDGWRTMNLSKRTESLIAGSDVSEWAGLKEDINASSGDEFGFAGFSDDGKCMFLYDRFDVWQADLYGASLKRLTDGKERGIRFRLIPNDLETGKTEQNIKTCSAILLSAYRFSDASSGYYELSNGKLKTLVFEGGKIDELLISNGSYAYRKQSFSLSPVVVFCSAGQRKIVYESNVSKKEFKQGFSKMTTYQSQGKELPAAVFYPSDYDRDVRYPVIVHIYEGLSRELHKYVNPSFKNSEGFNVANATAEGYVVVMPDLLYRMNDPGISSSQSLLDLVEYLIKLGIADKERIGLIGHSFGGYETLFAMTKTDVFATAIAGSGFADIVFDYHTMSTYMQRPEMWRYQGLQFRMNASFHANPDAYLRNSPIIYAGNVKKPILLYSGKNDTNVPPEQSMAFYLALRRIGTPTTMLLYPDEQHVILKEENQMDLTQKIKAWFNHYLKDQKPADWMVKGVERENKQ